ncbi:MAG: hypothetical protein ABIP27_17600 [Flavobacterium circumlabens]|uniref:hypothetical protein n=1 Tax=Flavobacterium circumlabens TaxID=2133765 RepID=UPI003262E549
MTKTETLQRLELLYLVLQFCTREQEKGSKHIFNTGERIEINQERGSMFEHLSFLNGEFNQIDVRKIIVSQATEEKIVYCLNLIIKNQFRGYPQSHFLEHLKVY